MMVNESIFFFRFQYLLIYLISINLILTANPVLQVAWRGSCRLLLKNAALAGINLIGNLS